MLPQTSARLHSSAEPLPSALPLATADRVCFESAPPSDPFLPRQLLPRPPPPPVPSVVPPAHERGITDAALPE